MRILNSPYFKLINSQANGDFPFSNRDIGDDFANTELPKSKFLFTIQFFPRNDITLSELGDTNLNTIKFALKNATRPVIEIHYEDINYYGYRTKVATKTTYGTVDVEFYDDITQRAHKIVTSYLNAISPISNVSRIQADIIDTLNLSAATMGALKNELGPLQAIRLTHWMIGVKSASQYVNYDYINPKIQNFNLDNLDMTSSEVSTVKFTFVYDSVNITYSSDEAMNTSKNTSNFGNIQNPPITNLLADNNIFNNNMA